ncbi:thioredoxin [candidate division KSB1 bacterium]|nr:thioredoxin [candidate division KSB1 bacterium]RQW06800.1 MAG: thioredoxin [candidate division KSB1 bacterium]
MATKNLTLDALENTLKENDIVLIDFWAEWCGPCRMFGPTFERVSEKNPDIAFMKVNTEKEQQLAAVFGIQSIPTLAIFRDNIMIFKQPGALPESALEDVIKQVRALDMDKIREEIETQQAEAPTAQ